VKKMKLLYIPRIAATSDISVGVEHHRDGCRFSKEHIDGSSIGGQLRPAISSNILVKVLAQGKEGFFNSYFLTPQ
jgi:hypothetical protein